MDRLWLRYLQSMQNDLDPTWISLIRQTTKPTFITIIMVLSSRPTQLDNNQSPIMAIISMHMTTTKTITSKEVPDLEDWEASAHNQERRTTSQDLTLPTQATPTQIKTTIQAVAILECRPQLHLSILTNCILTSASTTNRSTSRLPYRCSLTTINRTFLPPILRPTLKTWVALWIAWILLLQSSSPLQLQKIQTTNLTFRTGLIILLLLSNHPAREGTAFRAV